MNQSTLDGCIAKVDRAELQVNVMGEEWRIFLESNPYPSWVEVDDETGWNRVYFDFSAPAPPSFPVIVGEFAHDLRSALDHLAWREATECIGPEAAERYAHNITFPLAKNSTEFKKAKTLRYVGRDARAVMERHQPYKRGKGNGPKSLGLLHWFNRMDKHRTLQIASVVANPSLGYPWEMLDFNRQARLLDFSMGVRDFQRLKGKTQFASFQFDPRGPDPQVRVERTPTLSISYGQVPRPLRGITLDETIAQVRAVIEDFAELLPER